MVNPMRTPLNSIDSIVGSLSTVPCVHMRAKMCHVFSSRNWAENRWSCSAGNFGRIQPWIHNPQSKGRRQFHLANCKTGPHWHTFTIIHHLTWAVFAQIFSVWLLNILGKSQAGMQQTTCVCVKCFVHFNQLVVFLESNEFDPLLVLQPCRTPPRKTVRLNNGKSDAERIFQEDV